MLRLFTGRLFLFSALSIIFISKFTARFGKSNAIGVYNGGSHHEIENNLNKTFGGLLSLGPFPGEIPELQFHYSGGFGKGNTAEAPDWHNNSGIITYEHKYIVLSAQYYDCVGRMNGSLVDEEGNATPQHGYSFFSENKFLSCKLSAFGR